MPSVFAWPGPAAVTDPPAHPTLVYPARGIAELWQPARTPHSGALARLLGRTRAALLESLAEPASTHTLASRHGFAPSTVSEHLAALHDARLVIRRRYRHAVIYQRTPLGTELAAGSHRQPDKAPANGEMQLRNVDNSKKLRACDHQWRGLGCQLISAEDSAAYGRSDPQR